LNEHRAQFDYANGPQGYTDYPFLQQA